MDFKKHFVVAVMTVFKIFFFCFEGADNSLGNKTSLIVLNLLENITIFEVVNLIVNFTVILGGDAFFIFFTWL